ncbi:MAG: hypothetical protein KDC44_18795, partial [Phaeodactylibacter sp.]|nr:hypothetical protein [Phaeodactylibacter sp.]
CQTSTSISISQDIQVPIADAGADSLLTCLVTSLLLNGENSSLGPDLVYQWSTTDGNLVNGTGGLTPLIDAAGTYILQVQNSNNTCLSSDTVSISADTEVPTAVILPPVLMGCADPVVTLDAGGSSVDAGIIYEWTTLDGNILSNPNGMDIDVDAPGTYVLLVSDTLNGCFSDAQTTVIQDLTVPVVDAGPGTELTCTITNYELQGMLGGQVNQFVYEWMTTNGNIVSGQTTLQPTIDQAGTYTLTVTDTVNQCTAEANVIITQDVNLPTAVIEPSNNLNCTFTTATLDGSGSTQGGDLLYTWSTSNGNFVGSPDGLLVEVNAAGSYTLTINDTINSCLTSETVFLQLDTLAPTLALSPFDTLNCFNPQLNLDATVTGATDFAINWTTIDGNIVSNPDSLNPTVDLPGTYTLTITNADNGCVSETASQIAADLEVPTVDAGVTGILTCLETSLQLQGQADAGGAALQYQWGTTDGNILNSGNTAIPTVDAGGTYTLTATNLENGCSDAASVSIAVDQESPEVDPGSNGLLNCYASVLQLDATASSVGPIFSYQWTTTDGNILSGADGLQPEIDSAGTYLLTITNQSNGCVADSAVVIATDLELPTVDAGQEDELSCSITELNLNGSGSQGIDFQYNWSTTDGNIVSGANNLNPLIDAPGTYTLEILDQSNGCSAQAEVSVSSIVSFPNATAALDGELSCQIDMLTLDGSGSDTGPNFSYQWTTADGNILSGADGLLPLINAAGSYILTVTNTDNDCASTANVNVPIDTLAPIAEAGQVALLTCTVETLNLDGSGSSTGLNYSYQWATTAGNILSGANTLTPAIDQPGQYELTVTDLGNGCTTSDLV